MFYCNIASGKILVERIPGQKNAHVMYSCLLLKLLHCMIKNCMKLFVYFDERRRQLGRLYSYMHADQNAYSIRIVGYLHDTVMKWNVFVFQRNTTIGKKQSCRCIVNNSNNRSTNLQPTMGCRLQHIVKYRSRKGFTTTKVLASSASLKREHEKR